MLSKKQLAVFLLVWTYADAQSSTQEHNVTEITSIATSQDSTITAIYTPTSADVSGLAPPITAATTITSVDSAGETVAIAVAAGAGIVAGGGLAAWLFKPVPGAPPAPTEPPTFSTETQDDQPISTSPPPSTFSTITTSKTTSACPFPSSGSSISFAKAQNQPQWTLAIPSPSTVSAFAPECTRQGDNSELLRGTDPEYINALAQKFCENDLRTDQTATFGQADLDNDSKWKNANLNSVRVIFGFTHKLTNDACSDNCRGALQQIGTQCQYSSHVFYGGGSLKQGCGDYILAVDADPVTELECNSVPDPIWTNEGDESKNIKETVFSITYASDCKASGRYTVDEETCVKYLMETIDNCDMDTTMYKHGGTVTDTDNCAAFSFHPNGEDTFACYPKNKDAGYSTGGTHVAVTPKMAQDAIDQFCDREGDGQTYTLDPDNIPNSSEFTGDTCTESGMASCGYYYDSNGDRVSGDSVGNVFIRMSAQYMNPNDAYTCGSNIEYAIQGERCLKELGKVIGLEPTGQCVGDDPEQLDLGTFLENSDKGCVMWNMWAVKTG
ncbi:hypothetical protein Q7P37_010419 [Cladosporium fusiforme]